MVLEYIWSLIAAHLQHHCSTFIALLQHISAPGHFSTITAHLSTFYFLIPSSFTALLHHIQNTIAAHIQHHCSTFTAPLQHIYSTIAAHLQHHCSTFKTPLQHIYSTVAAHVLYNYSTCSVVLSAYLQHYYSTFDAIIKHMYMCYNLFCTFFVHLPSEVQT